MEDGESRGECGPDLEKLRGIIEIDETYIGGLEENKHASKKCNAGRGAVGKTTVLGMRERGGRVIAKPVSRNDKGTIQTAIIRQVEAGSTINTDEAGAYDGLRMLAFKHETVNHKSDEFVRDDVTTNVIESVFATAKAIDIPGEPVPDSEVPVYKDAKAAKLAAKFWVRRVAHEVARDMPEASREACERFVLRHRLSILAAFHKKLKRAIAWRNWHEGSKQLARPVTENDRLHLPYGNGDPPWSYQAIYQADRPPHGINNISPLEKHSHAQAEYHGTWRDTMVGTMVPAVIIDPSMDRAV